MVLGDNRNASLDSPLSGSASLLITVIEHGLVIALLALTMLGPIRFQPRPPQTRAQEGGRRPCGRVKAVMPEHTGDVQPGVPVTT